MKVNNHKLLPAKERHQIGRNQIQQLGFAPLFLFFFSNCRLQENISIPDNAFPSTLYNQKHVIVGTWLVPLRKLPHMPNLYRNHNARMQPRENIIFLDVFVKERTLETVGDYFSVD